MFRSSRYLHFTTLTLLACLPTSYVFILRRYFLFPHLGGARDIMGTGIAPIPIIAAAIAAAAACAAASFAGDIPGGGGGTIPAVIGKIWDCPTKSARAPVGRCLPASSFRFSRLFGGGFTPPCLGRLSCPRDPPGLSFSRCPTARRRSPRASVDVSLLQAESSCGECTARNAQEPQAWPPPAPRQRPPTRQPFPFPPRLADARRAVRAKLGFPFCQPPEFSIEARHPSLAAAACSAPLVGPMGCPRATQYVPLCDRAHASPLRPRRPNRRRRTRRRPRLHRQPRFALGPGPVA